MMDGNRGDDRAAVSSSGFNARKVLELNRKHQMNTLHKLRQVIMVLTALLLITSCDGLIYDDEGDCAVTYRLKFRYDMNLKFADAFANEVKSVSLYAFDEAGRLVWTSSERGAVLASEDYAMTLSLAPGKYRLVAWCGLDDGGSFELPDANPAEDITDLSCRIDGVTATQPQQPFLSDKDLQPLFHGMMDVVLPDSDDGEDYTYTMRLTKDTNVFRVVLQHLSGEDIDPDDFQFSIEDNNGWLAYDNSMLMETPVVYRPWAVYPVEAGVGNGESEVKTHADAATRTITDVRAVVAEMTTNRLFARDWTRFAKPMLKIRAVESGKTVVSLPVIDYALMVKGKHLEKMDNQEYLDRADEYNMTLILDENNRWVSTVIDILSWRLVVNNVGVGE